MWNYVCRYGNAQVLVTLENGSDDKAGDWWTGIHHDLESRVIRLRDAWGNMRGQSISGRGTNVIHNGVSRSQLKRMNHLRRNMTGFHGNPSRDYRGILSPGGD